MSGVAVLLRRDGAPADVAGVRRMLAAMAHRGPDGADAVAAGAAALGHAHFRLTPEEAGERQPLADRSGRYWIACDGRVDNRDELLPALGVPAGERAATSDVAAILLAFARWGVPGFARVVGPFAAAIWDAAERRLTLARDALGDRPLCYALLPGELVAASEEPAVLARPGVRADLDERRVAQFFAMRGLDSDATFFAAVKEVLPGHALVVEGERLTTIRYWQAEAREPLRLADEREYAEAFAGRLQAAVAAQLRGTGPAALLLSGGLDSSAIAGAAAAVAPAPAIKAVSWVFDELTQCDERRWIDPVVRHCDLEPLQFAGDGEWPFRDHDTWRHNPASPEDDLFRRLVERARGIARAAGCRVVLSGMFGDHLYAGVHGWFWERLRGGATGAAFAELWREARGEGAARRLLGALLPRRLAGRRGRLRRALAGGTPWLTARARELIGAEAEWPATAPRVLRPAQQRGVLGLLAAHGVSGETFHAACAGVEVRYPFRDRRVVELMLRLPSEQLYRPGRTRPVLRAAMSGRLPDAVADRAGKASLVALFRRGVDGRERAALRAALATGRPHWERYVRPEWVLEGAPRHEVEELVVCHCVLFGRWLDKRR